ncbi:CLUMA_CG019705, isoform A [Clunio marinus]|uniref:CLUMA_CG019705, isoform A n=1 Tax=Clunio marinus TaxID=568069 RepID=A0A1J1J565_9DIPT|nr:CLUMA_CG019705, isoform A [Clunio marinus]
MTKRRKTDFRELMGKKSSSWHERKENDDEEDIVGYRKTRSACLRIGRLEMELQIFMSLWLLSTYASPIISTHSEAFFLAATLKSFLVDVSRRE